MNSSIKLNFVVAAIVFVGMFYPQCLRAQHSISPKEGPKSSLKLAIGKFAKEGKFNLFLSKQLGSSCAKAVNYTVQVPYTKVVERDGQKISVNKMRTETRIRSVSVDEANVDLKIEQVKFSTVGGEVLTADEAKKRSGSQRAFVLLAKGESLNEFYTKLLRDQTLIVEVDPNLLNGTR